jgi:mannose-6-phosphate isomerase-like protein (cupin superfamily)
MSVAPDSGATVVESAGAKRERARGLREPAPAGIRGTASASPRPCRAVRGREVDMTTLMNLKDLVKKNDNFRKVVLTGRKSQLVLMNLDAGEEIGEEVHPDIDQLFFIVEGRAGLIVDGKLSTLDENDVGLVQAGTRHNLRNDGRKPVKLFTIYSPPLHPAGEVQKEKLELTGRKF